MEEDHPLKLVAFQDCPATPEDLLILVVAFPRELGSGLAIPFGESVVRLAVNATELRDNNDTSYFRLICGTMLSPSSTVNSKPEVLGF